MQTYSANTQQFHSEFDPFLKEHIERCGNAGRGKPSYLSSNTCLEFIELMGMQVLSEIIRRIKEEKYFSMSIDSTPDVLHTDQLTFIMLCDTQWLHRGTFSHIIAYPESHRRVCRIVLAVLDNMGINIKDCRGQCYDNTANMSDTYKGLQACIKELNPLTEWIPYAVHTLNLVCVNSANHCFETENFFSFVQMLFTFA